MSQTTDQTHDMSHNEIRKQVKTDLHKTVTSFAEKRFNIGRWYWSSHRKT